MNLEKLLDTTFNCDCGFSHTIPIKNLIYSEDALSQLPEILSSFTNGRRTVLIADQRTFDIAGLNTHKLIKENGWDINCIIVPDTNHGSPVCDDITQDRKSVV